MASKFPEDQGSDLSKHPAVTTYLAPPHHQAPFSLTQHSSHARGGKCQIALAPRYQPTILRMGITTSSKYMSHFAYTCKMWYPLNHVLEKSEYLWFYLTFCIVILDCGLNSISFRIIPLSCFRND